ncbi:hypothetical protein [Francisella marina]|uniref:Terminase small subunit n=1 Tax=Francisella marina TaxID=2249302 RepID=A0ABX5ZJK9_9GAMM|nr:hypothetical protein [Francisella marina]QEO57574.1 hypothetical protein F0R74_06800 [Francisella marina]
MTAKLTQQQENFAQEVANGKSHSDAFRIAYPKNKSKPKSIHEQASKLASDIKVYSRIEELKKELADKNLWTREKSVEILSQIAQYDFQTQTDRINAVRELNRMHGYEADKKIDLKSSDGSMSPKIPEIIINPITKK